MKRYLDGVEPTTSTTTTTTTTTTAAPSGGGCFPSASKVKLKNGKSVMMSGLQIGDQVQTGTVAGFLNISNNKLLMSNKIINILHVIIMILSTDKISKL